MPSRITTASYGSQTAPAPVVDNPRSQRYYRRMSEQKKSFYVTTPIFYVNDVPHIGHTYTTVLAHTMSNYHRLFGDNTLFLTGTDEHGQKVEAAAKAKGVDTQAFVDEVSQRFEETWKDIEIVPDIFMRTTFPWHKKVVQQQLQKIFDQGDIYTDEYEGWYSESEEIFYTEKDLVDGKSPMGRAVQRVTEKNYFFRMSKYQAPLIEYIHNNPSFIAPEVRKNEVLGFLKQDLKDLCISRPKSRLSWGIELPFDKDYVTYVWFDALLNYASAVGLDQDSDRFNAWWPNVHHLIGKDILTTHTVYWTTMLLALKLPLPKKIVAHSWWLNGEGKKMSKSEGTVLAPGELKKVCGIEGMRYYLMREMSLSSDANVSPELILQRYHAELSNNLGNLLSRVTALVVKFYDGKIPAVESKGPESSEIEKHGEKVLGFVKESISNFEVSSALTATMDYLSEVNRYLDLRAPWKAAKTDLAHAAETLETSLQAIRLAGVLLSPVLPQKMEELLTCIGCKEARELVIPIKLEGRPVQSPKAPLFPRLDKVDSTSAKSAA